MFHFPHNPNQRNVHSRGAPLRNKNSCSLRFQLHCPSLPRPLSAVSRAERGKDVRLESRGRTGKRPLAPAFRKILKALFGQMLDLQIVSSGPQDTPFLPQDLEATRRNQQVETTGAEHHHVSPNPYFERRGRSPRNLTPCQAHGRCSVKVYDSSLQGHHEQPLGGSGLE